MERKIHFSAWTQDEVPDAQVGLYTIKVHRAVQGVHDITVAHMGLSL